MFTGIISALGEITAVDRRAHSAIVSIRSESFLNGEPPALGESIAVNGVCLSVISFDESLARVQFDVSSETIRCTSFADLQVGVKVNLERSLRLGDRLDGHIVQGHVDCVAQVRAVDVEENTRKVSISLPEELSAYIAPKGAICIDGVSLTVGEVLNDSFTVYIIPITWSETNFQFFKAGTQVNLEADCVARYVARIAKLGLT